jgi:hypothetical protein
MFEPASVVDAFIIIGAVIPVTPETGYRIKGEPTKPDGFGRLKTDESVVVFETQFDTVIYSGADCVEDCVTH